MTSISRRLIAVDAQNLLGCSPRMASAACWKFAINEALDAVGFRDGVDHVVIAVSPQWACAVKALAPGARLVVGKGRHGPERALCEALRDTDFIASRYSEVVVASGDHVFCASVRALAGVGVPTTVAGLHQQSSRHLTQTAAHVIWLDHPHKVLGDAAMVKRDRLTPVARSTAPHSVSQRGHLEVAA